MLALKREKTVVIFVWFVLLTIIVPSVESARNYTDQSHNDSQSSPMKLNPKLSLQIKIHALLLWGSVGFLMPIGILVIRFASSCTCGKYSRVLFYLHVVLQIAAVALATAGAGCKSKEHLVPDSLVGWNHYLHGGNSKHLHRPPHIPQENLQECKTMGSSFHLRGFFDRFRLSITRSMAIHFGTRSSAL
ncbi:cytochrome b561 domain-containing protein [Carex littledalei]|uniref:Cytochrome b561 domain-containing protein n=1 Tax=Carex littledalei TaxID=544730 RepID=A0A833VD59_9POAL|nr:cytochrome b561 domain-containing protein [Carex littledalei]